ncbi:NADPH-dependent FMN reductase [Pseudomonas kurunegalensis]|uniref:NADPH-dependent FMN reductase n=1 Tax=Pseudomonas kurunegalensis TaxID=485880 RepID=UPI003556136F
MKFGYLLGSLRSGSLNAVVAKELQALVPADVQVESVGECGSLPHYDADLQADGFPEQVVAMAKAISEANALVIVTPEYNYSIPGVLKNAFDWLSRLPVNPFAGKPIAIQTASPGMIGGARAQYHLRQMLVYLDANVLNKPEVFIGLAGEKIDAEQGIITDSSTREHIAKQLLALHNAV